MPKKSEQKYIGDQGTLNYLRAQGSHIPFHIAKMRIMGAISSPNADLVPFQVFASFWPEGELPRFKTKEESEKFFEVLMGLWRRMETIAKEAKSFLSPIGALKNQEEAIKLVSTRLEELEYGFTEGFWGGAEDIPMPSASAALIDNLGHEVDGYNALLGDLESLDQLTPALSHELKAQIEARDEICIDTIQTLLLIKSKGSETKH